MNIKKTPWYALRSPELGKPFHDFHEACETKGILDSKIKTLITLALASTFYSQDRAQEYIEAAYNTGASKEEITEALLIAAAESANRNLLWVNDISVKPNEASRLNVFKKV